MAENKVKSLQLNFVMQKANYSEIDDFIKIGKQIGATDILLIDGYPAKYNSYITRLARWIRGDWQLLPWLSKTITIKNETKKRNPLNKLSKFKI